MKYSMSIFVKKNSSMYYPKRIKMGLSRTKMVSFCKKVPLWKANRVPATFINCFYKITKIVRALWLAERRVCMRVCKHGCGVKMFCFSRANDASTNLKKVLSWKPRQVYFIHPFPRRLKLGKSLETCCVNIFFAWADILSEKKPYFGKLLFYKTRTDSAYKLRVQHFATGKNLSRVVLFFSGKLSRILPTPLVFISGYANTENVFYCWNITRLFNDLLNAELQLIDLGLRSPTFGTFRERGVCVLAWEITCRIPATRSHDERWLYSHAIIEAYIGIWNSRSIHGHS